MPPLDDEPRTIYADDTGIEAASKQNVTETSAPDTQAAADAPYDTTSDEDLLKRATKRYKQAYEAARDDFETAELVQEFIAGDQWPTNIKSERESFSRPCLTLDHLNQYVRHVVNSGLQRRVDIRVLPMNDEGDDAVGEIIAGMIRQITQASTAKVAYETGLRHECQNGFGYWRVKAVPSGCTHPVTNEPLHEIVVRRIPDPRMVLVDPFVEYPDARDARYIFVLTKMAVEDYKDQYEQNEPPESWHLLDGKEMIPGIDKGSCVVAEYYYIMADGTLCWSVLTPSKVLAKGVHHGNAMPIIRCVGEEYEHDGKARHRGMIEPAMDAARAYNYSASAFIENVALAPIAPFVAAAGQIEQYGNEWKDAHRVPRAVLKYDPVSLGGQQVPPPQRSQPAGIPQGWQGMMQNLMIDIQSSMGLAQPSVLGTGGAPVQSGAGLAEQKSPGEINTYHFHEHWFVAIEQTGRVILSMIPTVYTLPQAVKIVGDDGVVKTALLNPGQDTAVAPTGIPGQAPMPPQDPEAQQEAVDTIAAYEKVFDQSYNPCIGKYDVVITLGPSSASKKQETNKMLMTMINAAPALMPVIGDLLFQSMDVPGADQIAKRMRAQAGSPTPEQMKAMQMQMAQLQQQNAEMEKLLLAEQQKSEATMQKTQMDNTTKMAQASLDANVQLEIATRKNINDLLIEKMRSNTKISSEIIKAITKASTQPTHESRMAGYGDVIEDLAAEEPAPAF